MSEDGLWPDDTVNYTNSYNGEGELTKALASEANGSTRLMDEERYTYDAAGNMISKEPGYNQYQTVSYTLNSLNEIVNSLLGGSTGFEWAISNAVSGSTTARATNVMVNGVQATLYADNSFYAIPFTIAAGPNTYTAIAQDTSGNRSTNSSTVYAIPTNNAYSYDSNGNMLSDGYKNFAYDDENELIAVWVPNAWSNSFAYDGTMRRRIERDYSYLPSSSSYLLTNELHFIYDGNLVVEERNASNVPFVSYTRGCDLSGSFAGAGGIGGLLARTTYGQEIPGAPTTAFYHADGNGNVTALIYPNQQLAAKYLYDPFGNILAMSGPLANFNKYRFSSKESDDNSGLYYYGYRFYEPALQRWVTRDPVEDLGFVTIARRITLDGGIGPNPYIFVGNSAVGEIDAHGLTIWFCTVPTSSFPTFGIGRHGYLWDDRPNVPAKDRECGQESCFGIGPNSSGNGGPGPGWPGNAKHGTICTSVDGSTGNEQQIMDYCRHHIDNGLWIPIADDCQSHARKCLRNSGLNPPPAHRF